MFEKEFVSSQTSAIQPTSSLHVNVWPSIPQIELYGIDKGGKRTVYGPSVMLKGEKLTEFLQWLEGIFQAEKDRLEGSTKS